MPVWSLSLFFGGCSESIVMEMKNTCISPAQAPTAQVGTSRRYTIQVRLGASVYYSQYHHYSSSVAGTEISYTVQNLQRGANYSIQIRLDVHYSECRNSYVSGSFSDPVTFQTNATSKQWLLTDNNYLNRIFIKGGSPIFQ